MDEITEAVKRAYLQTLANPPYSWDVLTAERTFDVWLAEIKRDAWDEGFCGAIEAEIQDDGYGNPQYPTNPYFTK